MTCRRFRSLCSSESLWEAICRREWGGPVVDALLSTVPAGERKGLSWITLYRTVARLSTLSSRLLPCKGGGASPRPRASHSLNLVDDWLVLFGGGCEGGRHMDDTWVAYVGNGIAGHLSWQQLNSASPSGRFGHTCTLVGGSLLLFGGITDSGVRLNDTWIGQVIRDGAAGIRILWRLLDVEPFGPSPRGAHAACCVGDKAVVIHGGIGVYGLRLGDAWILHLSDDLKSGRWLRIGKSFLFPSPRSGHTLTWIGGTRMILFAGRGSGYEVLNDVWLCDIGGDYPQWKEIKYETPSMVPSEAPFPRVGHSTTLVLGSKVLVYGGEDSERHRKNDFWILDASTLQSSQLGSKRMTRKMWKKLDLEGQCPNYRSFHGTCTDASGRFVYIFGGMVDGFVNPAEASGLRFDGELHQVELVLHL